MIREAKAASVLCGLSLLMLTGLGARFYKLQIQDYEAYRRQKMSQSLSKLSKPERRRSMFDITGRVISTSASMRSVFIDPKQADPKEVRELARATGLGPAEISKKISDPKKRFQWLLRRIPEAEAIPLKRFKGVGLLTEYKRQYPNGRSLGHLIGHVDIDGRGMEGFERVGERWLAPDLQITSALMDARRHVVSRDSEADAAPRGDVVLTVNMALQKIVEEELGAAWTQYRPQSALAVAMNPKTGAILAMAGFPDFDPAQPGAAPAEVRRNRILTDPYEPGSVIKTFIIAKALEKKLVTPETVLDCGRGSFRYGPRVLHDHHPYDRLTIVEILVKSSNIGACKIGIQLGNEGVRGALEQFGFGRATGIDLPGESGGRVAPLSRWTIYTLTSTPIGHEMLATPMQVLRGYCAIANGGLLVTPHVLCEVVDEGYVLVHPFLPAPRRVLAPETAETVKRMLRETVENGTATSAKVEGLSVGGKTGTTQVIDRQTGQYSHDMHISSFVGFAPVEDPQIAMIVVLDRPQGESYGGKVAAPVVGKTFARARDLIGKEADWARLRRALMLRNGDY